MSDKVTEVFGQLRTFNKKDLSLVLGLCQQLLMNHQQVTPSTRKSTKKKKKRKSPFEVKPQKESDFKSEPLWKLNKVFNKAKSKFLKTFKKEDRKNYLILSRSEALKAKERKGSLHTSIQEEFRKDLISSPEKFLNLEAEDVKDIMKINFDKTFPNLIDACDFVAGCWIQRKTILAEKNKAVGQESENSPDPQIEVTTSDPTNK